MANCAPRVHFHAIITSRIFIHRSETDNSDRLPADLESCQHNSKTEAEYFEVKTRSFAARRENPALLEIRCRTKHRTGVNEAEARQKAIFTLRMGHRVFGLPKGCRHYTHQWTFESYSALVSFPFILFGYASKESPNFHNINSCVRRGS